MSFSTMNNNNKRSYEDSQAPLNNSAFDMVRFDTKKLNDSVRHTLESFAARWYHQLFL